MYRPTLTPRHARTAPTACRVESLEDRRYSAVHAFFVRGTLSVFGDSAGNQVTISRNAAGAILLNGGAIGVRGMRPTVTNTRRITVYGLSGDDDVRLDETDGALPAATLIGGPGNDTLFGGSGADVLTGQAGNDQLFGQGGADLLTGGAGDDSLIGGADNDRSIGLGGNDSFAWAPGDASDVNEGGSGVDTVLVNGASASETFTAAPNGNRVRFDRTDPLPFTLDLGTIENLSLRSNAGDDTFTATGGLAPLIHLIVNGGTGNDTVLGSDGADELAGRDGDDFIDGNGGDDLILGGDGNDTFRWDAGDGNDVVEGQNDIDRMVFNGSDDAERIEVSPNGPRVRLRRDLGNVELDLNGLEQVTVNAAGGDDTVVASLLPAEVVDLTEDGGAGNDTLVGSRGNDTLVGGDGDDAIIGFRGADAAIMGAGNDSFEWLPGDGSDTVEGDAGRDTLIFNGENVDETFDLSANGSRARFARDLGGVAMDLNGVEGIDLNAFGGADTVTVNDQSTTGLDTFNVNLDGAEGTGFGDGAADTVVINGTAGNDVGQIKSVGTRIDAAVSLIPFVHITGSEGGSDTLTVNTLGGNDVVDASGLSATNAAQLIRLTEVGGAGNDRLTGSQGGDTFVWSPGDGSDAIDGGDNPDTMVVNGSDGPDEFTASANGGRTRITRNVEGAVLDVGGVETLTINPLGGDDAVTVNDLTGTGVTRINMNLGGAAGTDGDGRVDSVIVNGSGRPELIPVLGNSVLVAVDGGFADGSGLPYFMVIRGADATDTLRINGNGGDDRIAADALGAVIRFTADGGDGNDVLIGGGGNDVLFGGADDDTLIGGPGADTLDGGPGNNVLVQD